MRSAEGRSPDVIYVNGEPIPSAPPRFHDRRPGYGTPAVWPEDTAPKAPLQRGRKPTAGELASVGAQGLLCAVWHLAMGLGLLWLFLLNPLIAFIVILVISSNKR